jgi:carbonic anhydrase/acetyltransferase-like protein (isoleucine patch superfamily)
VAPTAALCGDVEIGDDCRIMFGAVVVAEDTPVRIGARSVVMENAVIRSWPDREVVIGTDVMIGPAANVNGAHVEDDAFIAGGAILFPGARVGTSSIVRAHGVVHIDSHLPARRVVPEGWTGIGQPAEVVPPGGEQRSLFSLYGMNFTRAVFGEGREEVGLQNYLDLLGRHADDEIVG